MCSAQEEVLFLIITLAPLIKCNLLLSESVPWNESYAHLLSSQGFFPWGSQRKIPYPEDRRGKYRKISHPERYTWTSPYSAWFISSQFNHFTHIISLNIRFRGHATPMNSFRIISYHSCRGFTSPTGKLSIHRVGGSKVTWVDGMLLRLPVG
jgi:hypothetical protein